MFPLKQFIYAWLTSENLIFAGWILSWFVQPFFESVGSCWFKADCSEFPNLAKSPLLGYPIIITIIIIIIITIIINIIIIIIIIINIIIYYHTLSSHSPTLYGVSCRDNGYPHLATLFLPARTYICSRENGYYRVGDIAWKFRPDMWRTSDTSIREQLVDTTCDWYLGMIL